MKKKNRYEKTTALSEISVDEHCLEVIAVLDNDLTKNYTPHEIARILHSIAQSYLMRGKLEETEIYLKDSVDVYRATDDLFSLAFSLSQYALILRHKLKTELAEETLMEVAELSKSVKLSRKDAKNIFFKPYFLNLLEIFNSPNEAKLLRKKILKAWLP